jgi:ubiquinone/menaquinone biosynthesis C-methylase UbiE
MRLLADSSRCLDTATDTKDLADRLAGREFLTAKPDSIGLMRLPGGSMKKGNLSPRGFYDEVSFRLDGTPWGKFSYFLNYGYVADGSAEHARFKVSPQPNEASVKLVLEVIGNCKLDGKKILDVSCGRGGTISVINANYSPRHVVGIDLSPCAIDFDRKMHSNAHTDFYVGDAESLPCEDHAFDVVINIEASHLYPHRERYYKEVERVLVSSGYFLYADLLPHRSFDEALAILQGKGFTLNSDRDITNNVLRSCGQIAKHRVRAFGVESPNEDIDHFLAAPGSGIYDQMKSGNVVYRILELFKTV